MRRRILHRTHMELTAANYCVFCTIEDDYV